MYTSDADYVFRSINPEKNTDPLINNGGIDVLSGESGEFTWKDMLETLERDGGYRNVRDTQYPNWTYDPNWLENFTGEETLIIVAESECLQNADENYQHGKDAYIREVPWQQNKEIIFNSQKNSSIQEHLSEAEKQGVKLTPAQNPFKYTTNQYREQSGIVQQTFL